MSLNWSLKNVANADACYVTCEKDDPMRGMVAGERYLSGTTETLIFATMFIDVGRFTAENVDEVTRRLIVWERSFGALRVRIVNGKRTDVYFTRADVEAHIGLTTNVVTTSRAKFDARVRKLLRDEAARRARRVLSTAGK